MRQVLVEIRRAVKSNAPVGVVVGNNTTTIADTRFVIETDQFLTDIATDIGFSAIETIGKRLTSFGVPDAVHSQNAMTEESILLLEAPD
jgi:RNA-binding protein YhbY